MKSFIALPLLATGALAHFSIDFPEWRGDSFGEGTNQYIFPCANVSQENAKRTLWPLEGGAVSFDSSHKWTYYTVNLGLGNEVASFNITLTPELHNATGNGTLCVPKLTVPTGLVQEGQNASIQVVTFGASGNALYNCADITFSSEAVDPTEEQCKTNGVTDSVVGANATSDHDHDHDHDDHEGHEGHDHGDATSDEQSASPSPTGAALSTYGSSFSIAGTVAVVVSVALGMF